MTSSQRRLRVLITNNTLDTRAGSELYVRDLALGLLRRGHAPVAYSTVLGEVADELTAASIPVLDDLRALSVAPDVIHAHHHLDAMCAMLRFPDVPAVYVCHGWQPWQEQPPVFPAIRRYVGVDDVCTERILTTPGVDAARVRTVYNAVDLTRFGSRTVPLPERPRSALIFSNYATEDNYIGTIREACRAASIERVDVIGRGTGTAVDRPELVLPQYDLVFAKARCALEAMAVGAAVIVADFSGLGGMVTPANVEAMRRLNFGLRAMQRGPLTVESVGGEIARYHAESSTIVSALIRSRADAACTITRFEGLYRGSACGIRRLVGRRRARGMCRGVQLPRDVGRHAQRAGRRASPPRRHRGADRRAIACRDARSPRHRLHQGRPGGHSSPTGSTGRGVVSGPSRARRHAWVADLAPAWRLSRRPQLVARGLRRAADQDARSEPSPTRTLPPPTRTRVIAVGEVASIRMCTRLGRFIFTPCALMMLKARSRGTSW